MERTKGTTSHKPVRAATADKIAAVIEPPYDATDMVLLEEASGFIGETTGEEELLAGLGRLYHSLRGPEHLLDKGGYSRPLPTRPPRGKKDSGEQ